MELSSPRRTVFAEAITAVNRAVVFGFKRHFRFLTAFRARYGKHLAVLSAVAIASAFVAAVAATYGFVLESAFVVKFLFARAEDKFFSTVLAHECFVFESH